MTDKELISCLLLYPESYLIAHFNTSFIILFTASDYSVLLIPNSPGAVHDLSNHRELGNILNAFIADRSKTWCLFILTYLQMHNLKYTVQDD